MAANPFDILLPAPLKRVLGGTLQQILNRLLALDDEAAAQLSALEGRSISIHLQAPPLALQITAQQGRLLVAAAQDTADLQLRLRPAALAAAALRGGDALPPGAVQLAGDAELARRLERLARQWQPDLEAALAARLGERLGVPLAQALTRAFAATRRHLAQRVEDTGAWLRDEVRLCPPRSELEDFHAGVDQLRERVERLAARLQMLQTRRSGSAR